MSRVVVMVAMEEEAQFLRPLLEDVSERPDVVGVVKTYRGTLSGLMVDIVISGIGNTYAAMATTATLTAEPAMAVVSCGCSGAHMPEQRMGDIVIGATVTPLAAEVIDRHGKSRLAGVRCSMLDKATMSFEADPRLLRMATDAAKSVRDDIAAEKNESASSSQSTLRVPRIDVGVVGSSDVWRQSPAVIDRVHTELHSLCEEMEAHAVAQVCGVFGVPFVAIKDVANSEIHPEPIQLEPTDSVVPDTCQVGIRAARVTERTLQLLAADGDFKSSALPSAGKRRAATTSARASTRLRLE